MIGMKIFSKALRGLCLLGMGLSLQAQAQFRGEVVGVGLTQMPVAVAPFKGESSAPQKTAEIVLADLQRTGQFRAVDAQSPGLDEMSRPDWAIWRQRSAEALLAGSVTRLADGRFDVRARLWDVVKGQDLGEFKDLVVTSDLRLVSHRVADWVYERLTGSPGAFASRIAYVTHSGGRYQLWVADADGQGAQSALSSPEPIISPAWSPNGARLAYVSFESRKPVIYLHDLATGQRRPIANFKGSNSAPAWAPDGQSLVATLSRDGGSQLYRIDLSSGQASRLMQSSGIDTEPVFSKDGQHIYFVSDRGGSPQIYRMPSQGGPAQRVTFTGSYNISPALSPNGRWLAYISRQGAEYKVQVMDLSSGQIRSVSSTRADEKPSFAPNSLWIVYATIQDGREALMSTHVEGSVKARLAGQPGDIREPQWGPMH